MNRDMQRRRRVMVIFAVIALGQTTGSIVQRSNSAEIAARDMTFEVVLVGGAVLGLLAAACHLPISWVARITLAFCGAALLMIMAAHGGIGGFDEASLLVLPAISSLVLGSRDTLFFLVRDTELSEEKLRAALAEQPHAAHHDALTRLANRAAVAQWAGASHDKGDPLRVFLVDPDGFKGMNDAFSHAAGDETLATMEAQLKMSAPAGSLVARLGGDEFLVACPLGAGGTVGDDSALGERLVPHLVVTRSTDLAQKKVTASVGSADYPADGATLSAVMANADRALYMAKRRGKTRYMTYHAACDTAVIALQDRARDGPPSRGPQAPV